MHIDNGTYMFGKEKVWERKKYERIDVWYVCMYVQESVHLPKPILCKEQSTTNKLNFFELLSVLLKHFSMKK